MTKYIIILSVLIIPTLVVGASIQVNENIICDSILQDNVFVEAQFNNTIHREQIATCDNEKARLIDELEKRGLRVNYNSSVENLKYTLETINALEGKTETPKENRSGSIKQPPEKPFRGFISNDKA